MTMAVFRTRFGGIVCEFAPPRRTVKNTKIIIFAAGLPSSPSQKNFLELWSKKGYWVFFPRYRGAWESSGQLLKNSPDKDILDVLDGLSKGFKDIFTGRKFNVRPQRVYIFGTSFGGPAAILASRDKRIDKVVALSPVVDWSTESPEEPLDFLYKVIKDGFGKGYRISKRNWSKLKRGNFYNPARHMGELNPEKIFIIHARDDRIVLYKHVAKFAKKLGCKFKTYRTGGHLRASRLIRPALHREIARFLQSK